MICVLKKNIIPIHSIEAIASWYIFMRKIHNQELIFDYYEPRWDWIKNFLTENKIDDFTNSLELWSTVPQNFSDFREILKEKITDWRINDYR